MKALGVYIFAGGFTLGIKKHFEVIAHLEGNPYGVSTMRANQPEIPVFDDPERWPIDTIKNEFSPIDLVYGNPPCAAWSPLGRVVQAGATEEQWSCDARVDCTRIHFNVLRLLRPTVWIWESVPAAYRRGRSLVDELTRDAVEMGYSVDYVLHDAKFCGTPQKRRRFMMVATKVDIDWKTDWALPPTTREMFESFSPPPGLQIDIARDNFSRQFIKHVKPGDGLRGARETYVEKTGRTDVPKIGFSYRRMHPDRIADAMISTRLYHPFEDRWISTQEMLHFSGFPLDYQLDGTATAQGSLIGRGVMPPVGEWFARNIKRGIERGVETKGRVREVNHFMPPGTITEMEVPTT